MVLKKETQKAASLYVVERDLERCFAMDRTVDR